MSRFAVDHLSPLAARRRLDEVDLEEKSRLAEGLALIALMDARRDYLEAGHSCMQRYCMDHLHMSEEQALRRIRVARLGRQFPTVFDRIADGRLTMSNACELAPVLTTANAETLLDAATHQTKLTVRRLAIEAVRAKALPVLAVASVVSVESADCSDAPAPSLEALCGLALLDPHDTSLTSPAPARVNLQVRGRIVSTADGARELRVLLTDDTAAALAQAQDLLSHVIRDGDPAVVVARALAHYAAHLKKRRFGAKPGANARTRVPRGRHIPAAMRHEVAARDGHCCSFVSDDGHRCGETRGLQFDHIAPIALGGGTTTDNLRLLCSGHNRHEAAKRLGVENVAAKRELTERARATARDAKRREDVRRAERASQAASSTATDDGIATARRESGLDTIAALRSLGFTIERARLAAERTASLADGPLEERVRAALMSHGERLGTRVDFRVAARSAG